MRAMQIGALLLDLEGRVVSANPEARALSAHAGPLFLDRETVDLSAFRDHGRNQSVRLEAEDVRLEARLEPMLNGGPQVTHLLLVLRPSYSGESRRQMLVRRFGLTPAEVRLAEQLMDGMTSEMAAERLKVSIHTVRTYLKRLYQKTGAKNQACLVHLLLQAERS